MPIGLRSNAGTLFLLSVAAAVLITLVRSAPVAAHDARFHVYDAGGGLVQPDRFMEGLTPLSRLQASAMSTVNCVGGMAGPFPCKDVDLVAYLNTNSAAGVTSSDIEGWTDPQTGKEWVIQGHSDATTFIDVSNPETPVVYGTMPPAIPSVLWKELEVYNNHVYVVQDLVGVGMQIFDLTRLRTPAPGGVYLADAVYGGVGNVHTITINADTGIAYLNGSNTCGGGGPHVLDLKPNPIAPVFLGCISQDGYTHDAQCVVYHGPDTAHTGEEICATYNEDTLTIWDVTSKNPFAPVQLSRTGYTTGTGKYTHQGWFTEDQRYLLLDDELDEEGTVNTRTYLWDVADLENPTLITPWEHQTKCTDHNQFIIGRFSYQSNYACGLRVMDISDVGSSQLTQVAYFDTAPAHDFIAGASDGGDFDGDWANYPYFRSGIVVTSNISKGLFVLRPHLPTAAGAVLFSDGAEGGTNGWTVSHVATGGAAVQCNTDEWHQTTTDVHNGTTAWTNSPYTQAALADTCVNYLTSPPVAVPAGTAKVTLTFWEHHFTEGGTICNPPANDPETCDFGEVELTNNGGTTWTTVSNRYENGGPNDSFVESSLPLGNQAGKTIQIRFKFTSDANVASPPFLGWSIDDVELRASTPTAALLASYGARRLGRAAVQLNWRTLTEVDVQGFNVWRTSAGKTTKVNRTLVRAKAAGRARGAAYRLVDPNARGAAVYRLQAVRSDATTTWVGRASVKAAR